MTVNLVYTNNGTLIPETDTDAEIKRSLKPGQTYVADIKIKRNADHHRKYFAMLNTAWEFLPENVQSFYKHNVEVFRKYLEITVGHCEIFFSPKRMEWVEGPKSIAFDKMDQAEFEALYNRVRTLLDTLMSRYMTKEQFETLFLPY